MPQKQDYLLRSAREVLAAIAKDVRGGLLETVGVESFLMIDEHCSIILELPAGTDTELVARAIDLENVESWCDEKGRVHIGISLWMTTKEVDQAVLCAIKVIHVLLGLHTACEDQTAIFREKTVIVGAGCLECSK